MPDLTDWQKLSNALLLKMFCAIGGLLLVAGGYFNIQLGNIREAAIETRIRMESLKQTVVDHDKLFIESRSQREQDREQMARDMSEMRGIFANQNIVTAKIEVSLQNIQLQLDGLTAENNRQNLKANTQ